MTDLPIYDTVYESGSDAVDVHRLYQGKKRPLALFTSASTVRGFAEACKALDFSLVKALCIGRQTQAEADRLGMETYVSKEATMDSLIARAVELVEEEKAGQ